MTSSKIVEPQVFEKACITIHERLKLTNINERILASGVPYLHSRCILEHCAGSDVTVKTKLSR